MSQLSDLSGITGVPVVLLWVAAALLLLAGAAKLRWPAGTVAALGDAGLPAGPSSVRFLGLTEVATGAAALLVGGPLPAAGTALLYLAFAGFVVRQRRSAGSSCGCFGEARTPVGAAHVVVNVVAAAAATAAALTAAPALHALVGARPVELVGTILLVAVAAWLVRLGLTAGAELQAAVALHRRETTA